MTKSTNQNPEQIARDKIDQMLVDTGWVVQSKNEVDLGANIGVAMRENQADTKFADYILYVDRKPVGVIEAKREEEGLAIFYNQPYNRRDITFKMMKDILDKLKMDKPMLAPKYV